MTTWSEATMEAVRGAGHRSGAAQRAVVDLLARQDCCLTAQDIFDRLRGEGRRVSLASVYRALELLGALAVVRRVEVGSTSGHFERVDADEHHHHLVCDDCGRVEAFEDDRLERAINGVAAKVGYSVGGHEVVLRGACGDCAR